MYGNDEKAAMVWWRLLSHPISELSSSASCHRPAGFRVLEICRKNGTLHEE